MTGETERGLSMVEILVALTIVAIALLGLLALQARAASLQQDAFHRRQAAELVAQYAERMRANHLGFAAGAYALRLGISEPAPAAVRTCLAPCSGQAVAARDLDEWRIELRRRLPGAAVVVQYDESTRSGVDVAVAWPEPLGEDRDPVCDTLPALGVAIPARYRCYRSRVFP